MRRQLMLRVAHSVHLVFSNAKSTWRLQHTFVRARAHAAFHLSRHLVEKTFDGTTKINYSDGVRLDCLEQLDLGVEIFQALPKIRSLPGLESIAIEVEFLYHFASLASATAKVSKQRQGLPVRKDRTITEELVAVVSALRSKLDIAQRFVQKHDLNNLFSGKQVGVAHALKAVPRKQTLGVSFDVSGTQDTMRAAGKLVREFCDDWCQDVADLGGYMKEWRVDGWELHASRILQPEHRALVMELLNNESYGRLKKAVGLFNQWRALLHSLNSDGHAALIDATTLKEWKTVAQCTAQCCRFTWVLHFVLRQCPDMKNVHQRKEAAKKFEQGQAGFDMGEDLAARLKALTNGDLPVAYEPDRPSA